MRDRRLDELVFRSLFILEHRSGALRKQDQRLIADTIRALAWFVAPTVEALVEQSVEIQKVLAE